MQLQTMMRNGVARTGEQIGLEVYGFGEENGDGYSLSILWGISLSVFLGAIRLALRGEPLGAAALVAGVIGLYAIIAIRQGFSEDEQVDADHALVVTTGRVLIGDTANQPIDRAIGALPRTAVTHAVVEVAGRAVSPQQGASRVSLHGPSGEVAALVTPGVTTHDAVKAITGSTPKGARSTNSAGPLWFLGALGIFVSVIAAVFGAVLVLGADGGAILAGVGMLIGAAGVGFGCVALMRQANARAKARGENVRYEIDLRSTPRAPLTIETTQAGLTPVRFGATAAVGALLVVMAVVNVDDSDTDDVVTAGAAEAAVTETIPDTSPTIANEPIAAPEIPASCDGTTSTHWGGQLHVAGVIVGAGHCSLTIVRDGAVSIADVPCPSPQLLGRSRPAALNGIIPVWCDGDVVGIDAEQRTAEWRWEPETASTIYAASEFGTDHLAIQTVDGIDVIDLRTGTTAWFDLTLGAAAFAGTDDTLFVSVGDTTTARRWDDGSVIWEAPIGLRWMASYDGALFGFRDRSVVRLDPQNGDVLASSVEDRHFINGFFQGGNGRQLVTIDQAGTTVVVLNAETLAQEYALPGLGLSIGVVDQGLYARYDYDAASMIVHDVVTGAELGRWQALPSRPALDGRTLYSATSDGQTVSMHATPID